jgi:acyl-CoA thioester hydrolase
MTRLHVPTLLRWSDLDAYGHVNNANMLRLLEEARIQAFWVSDVVDGSAAGANTAVGLSTAVLDARPGTDTFSVIARQEVEYLRPIEYTRHPLDIHLWFGRLGGASLEVSYEVWSVEGIEPTVLYTRAMTTIVLVDSSTMKPRRIRAEEREAWLPFVEEPVQFSRRDR